ncbi:hypothetical protein AB1Y20_007664 [Prymnesium parvum]|uniref:Protein kinase domain-containing protein n=1 Tax=Prymnesium parvum TaxID=97485 RepID=A0AB34IYM1_PRYPA
MRVEVIALRTAPSLILEIAPSLSPRPQSLLQLRPPRGSSHLYLFLPRLVSLFDRRCQHQLTLTRRVLLVPFPPLHHSLPGSCSFTPRSQRLACSPFASSVACSPFASSDAQPRARTSPARRHPAVPVAMGHGASKNLSTTVQPPPLPFTARPPSRERETAKAHSAKHAVAARPAPPGSPVRSSSDVPHASGGSAKSLSSPSNDLAAPPTPPSPLAAVAESGGHDAGASRGETEGSRPISASKAKRRGSRDSALWPGLASDRQSRPTSSARAPSRPPSAKPKSREGREGKYLTFDEISYSSVGSQPVSAEHSIEDGVVEPISWQRGQLIGTGSFGHVYFGMNTSTGELMAVKQILYGGTNSTSALHNAQALQRELITLQDLSHPNIVRYLGIERDDVNGTISIFLEYCAGGSIASLLERFGPFSEPQSAVYTRMVIHGLSYLHSRSILHRDIKGANVLVDSGGVCKLSDFGASMLLDSRANSEGWSLRGTPYWMAPEVIKQTGHGKEADIWSLGCTIIEMLSGKPPWSHLTSQVAALFHIASAKAPPVLPPGLSPAAADMILWCMRREPSERPTSSQLTAHAFVVQEPRKHTLSRTPVVQRVHQPPLGRAAADGFSACPPAARHPPPAAPRADEPLGSRSQRVPLAQAARPSEVFSFLDALQRGEAQRSGGARADGGLAAIHASGARRLTGGGLAGVGLTPIHTLGRGGSSGRGVGADERAAAARAAAGGFGGGAPGLRAVGSPSAAAHAPLGDVRGAADGRYEGRHVGGRARAGLSADAYAEQAEADDLESELRHAASSQPKGYSPSMCGSAAEMLYASGRQPGLYQEHASVIAAQGRVSPQMLVGPSQQYTPPPPIGQLASLQRPILVPRHPPGYLGYSSALRPVVSGRAEP